MIRGTLVATALIAATIEPAMPDFDLTRYAITQGGLLAVDLVLLWWIRQDLRRKDDRLDVMTKLVADSTAALTRNTEVSERVARALDNLERRHR